MERNLSDYNVLAIGGSAGSLQVILDILPKAPTNFDLPIILILHRGISEEEQLASILNQRTALFVKEVEDKDLLKAGTIFLAPADYHLLVERDGTLTLDFSEKVNYSRPSIDATFNCIADVYGSGSIGMLLSGASHDGAEGLVSISEQGGLVLIQNPLKAHAPTMPAEGLRRVPSALLVDTEEFPSLLFSYPQPKTS